MQVLVAVVQLADDEKAVDVAGDEIHQHFGAMTWGEGRALLGAGEILQLAHPGAAEVFAWGAD